MLDFNHLYLLTEKFHFIKIQVAFFCEDDECDGSVSPENNLFHPQLLTTPS